MGFIIYSPSAFHTPPNTSRWFWRAALSLARVQHSQTNHFFPFVTDENVVVGHFRIGGATGLFEVDVKHIGLGIVGRPEVAMRRAFHGGEHLHIFVDFGYGHNCFLRLSAASRRVRNAVMTKPSPASSRYTATRILPSVCFLRASSSPPPPARIRSGSVTASSTSS